MAITITGVEGMVQVREGADKPWQKAQAGMSVGEGAEFRTGPRSAVRCLIPPDQTLTLDRLGTVKLLQAMRDGNVVKTRVGMQYGRTRYDIEEAGVEHRSELVTPSSTLAIRGTKVSVFDQPPFAPSAVSLTGRAVYSTARREVAFGGKNQGKTEVSSTADSPGQVALQRTYVDPNSSYGRPPQDQKVITDNPSTGKLALTSNDFTTRLGSTTTDQQLAKLLEGQGRFTISLRWLGKGDFDLFVMGTDASGQPYTLGNPGYNGSVFKDVGLFGGDPNSPAVTTATSPDGGTIKFNQNPFRDGGFEFASWGQKKGTVPQQEYSIAIVYYDHRNTSSSYPVRSPFRVDAILDGKRVPVLVNFDQVIQGSATQLKYGAFYVGTASLVPAEKVLTVTPPDKLNGDVRISGVDLRPEALDLNGQPLGDINRRISTAAASASVNAAKPATVTPVATAAPARTARPARLPASSKPR